MIHSLKGILIEKGENSFAVEIGGIAFLVRSSAGVIKDLPPIGQAVKVFTYLHVKQDGLELYGFLKEKELDLFGLLIGISGIGPKSALGILSVETVEKLKAAISEGRAELLTKASGIGKKTADRIILELRGKISGEGAGELVGIMESDHDIVEALNSLGYTKTQAREALSKIDSGITKMEGRIKEALKILKGR